MKIIPKLVIVMATSGLSIALLADTWKDSATGYTWTYQTSNEGAEIYGPDVVYESGAVGYTCGVSPKPTGCITVPSILGGKPVVIVGRYAFAGCFIY